MERRFVIMKESRVYGWVSMIMVGVYSERLRVWWLRVLTPAPATPASVFVVNGTLLQFPLKLMFIVCSQVSRQADGSLSRTRRRP